MHKGRTERKAHPQQRRFQKESPVSPIRTTFDDGFPNLFIENAETLRNKNVAFLASFHNPSVIFQQLSVIYALPRMFVATFTLILPFFPTGTSERVEDEGEVATAATMARVLSSIPPNRGGPTSLVIYDIHALQVIGVHMLNLPFSPSSLYASVPFPASTVPKHPPLSPELPSWPPPPELSSHLRFNVRRRVVEFTFRSLTTSDWDVAQERFFFGDNVMPYFQTAIPILKDRLRHHPDRDIITIAYPDEGAWKRFHKQFADFDEVESPCPCRFRHPSRLETAVFPDCSKKRMLECCSWCARRSAMAPSAMFDSR
eukprot:1177951-Prorocentrum_minimum.AAC.5